MMKGMELKSLVIQSLNRQQLLKKLIMWTWIDDGIRKKNKGKIKKYCLASYRCLILRMEQTSLLNVTFQNLKPLKFHQEIDIIVQFFL